MRSSEFRSSGAKFAERYSLLKITKRSSLILYSIQIINNELNIENEFWLQLLKPLKLRRWFFFLSLLGVDSEINSSFRLNYFSLPKCA